MTHDMTVPSLAMTHDYAHTSKFSLALFIFCSLCHFSKFSFQWIHNFGCHNVNHFFLFSFSFFLFQLIMFWWSTEKIYQLIRLKNQNPNLKPDNFLLSVVFRISFLKKFRLFFFWLCDNFWLHCFLWFFITLGRIRKKLLFQLVFVLVNVRLAQININKSLKVIMQVLILFTMRTGSTTGHG